MSRHFSRRHRRACVLLSLRLIPGNSHALQFDSHAREKCLIWYQASTYVFSHLHTFRGNGNAKAPRFETEDVFLRKATEGDCLFDSKKVDCILNQVANALPRKATAPTY